MKFEETRTIHWPILESVGLAFKVHELLIERSWVTLFALNESTYQELTAEVLAMFEIL